ncbi:MAG: RNA polymerase sigma factor [Turicibacter sp.]|nr:RNA polymerase sigma factor [Turicibacter sp.]
MDKERQVKKWIKRIVHSADKRAANFLIAHYFDEIYGYVFKRTSNEEVAMDVTQEIFVSTLQAIDRYDHKKSSFRTWLYQITKRRIADYYRSKEYQLDRLVEHDDEAIDHLASTLGGRVEQIVEIGEISDFVDQLDADSRDIFKLKAFEGYTFRNISQIINVPESTVKASFYATQKLVREAFLCND